MSARLRELERLVKQYDATARIDICPEYVSVTFKSAGRHAETVTDRVHMHGPHASMRYSTEEVLAELLRRLGYAELHVTTAMIIAKMTDAQRARCQVLLREVQAIKREALDGAASEEPRLASPRSSLHPDVFGAPTTGRRVSSRRTGIKSAEADDAPSTLPETPRG